MFDDHDEIQRVEVVGQGIFEYQRVLAQGGQAQVLLGRELSESQRLVAIKLLRCTTEDLHKKSQGHPSVAEMFSAEERHWVQFGECENVVPMHRSFHQRIMRPIIFDADPTDALPIVEWHLLGFVMPYSPLGDLSQHIDVTDTVPRRFRKYIPNGDKEMLDFLIRIAKGIRIGHNLDICHGDIKAKNVLLFREGLATVPKVMDFGMSVTTTNPDATLMGFTPEYAAPELFDDGQKPTKEADVFALGYLFFEILMGTRPSQGMKTLEKLGRMEYHRTANRRPDDISELRREYTGDFGDNLGKMIEAMTKIEPRERIRIDEVIGRLELYFNRKVREVSASTEWTVGVRSNTYRWHPDVHRILKHELRYYIIDGHSPEGDPKWLNNNLRTAGIHGYSLYRVLGDPDYILRVAVRQTYYEKLDRVMDNFRREQSGDFRLMTVLGASPFYQRETMTCQWETEAEILQAVLDRRDKDDADAEYQAFQEAGLVVSRLGNHPQGSVRFFMTIQAGNPGAMRSDRGLKIFAKGFRDEIAEKTPAEQVSIYWGHGDFSLLLKFRLSTFNLIKEVLHVVRENSLELRARGNFVSTRTYPETDERGLIESDDGSIIAKVDLIHAGQR